MEKTSAKETGVELIADYLEKLTLHRIWRVDRVHGSILNFDFGDEVTKTGTNGGIFTIGEVHMSIDYCDWVLSNGATMVLNSGTIDAQNSNALDQLLEAKINALVREESCLVIHFSNGFSIRLAVDLENYGVDDELMVVSILGMRSLCFYPLGVTRIED